YYFKTSLEKSVLRNNQREGKAKIPEKGLFAALKRLQIPSFAEGFDELFCVWINEENHFVVEEIGESKFDEVDAGTCLANQ
ncbi:MAG TPA: hypothetical protein VK400_19810, partial [Pyrinomonadaceae bacterium]|nr:hypothetical protein [Pyrinomonadaceae bacterium]